MVDFAGLVCVRVMVLAQLMGPGMFLEQQKEEATPKVHVAAQTHSTSTQPTSQPAATEASTSADTAGPGGAFDSFKNTVFGQLASGKKTLSPGEVVQLQFWLDAVKDLLLTAVGIIPRLFVGFLFFVLFYWIYRGVRRVALSGMKNAHVDSSIRDMLGLLLKWGIVGFGLIIACNQVGIQITGLLTGTAIIGLAIGFAAQETLANFIAGMVIFWDKPFKVGDWIDVDGKYGRVLRVSFRSTRVLNGDGEVIVLPNTSMLAQKLTNHSTNPISRVKVEISIGYRESIDRAREVLLSIVDGDSRICGDPQPGMWVQKCGPSSVDLVLGFWIQDESVQKKMASEYLEKAKKALDDAGISIPFPHMQVFLENTPAVQLLAARSDGAMRKAG